MISFHHNTRTVKSLLALVVLFLLSIGQPTSATAGNWRVVPIKLFFDAKTRSEVITVTNDGDQVLPLEISAMTWSQDQNGQDVYLPADDLIFFPKQLFVEPKQERVIRAGIKIPAVAQEKTYRLFIREVPDSRQTAENAVAIAIQFGVPIFVAPAKAELKGDLAEVTMQDGQLAVTVKNQGNSHFRVNRIKVRAKLPGGEALDAAEAPGWYLLAGSQRTFKVDIPPELCLRSDALDILVEADRITLTGSTNVDKTKCSAP